MILILKKFNRLLTNTIKHLFSRQAFLSDGKDVRISHVVIRAEEMMNYRHFTSRKGCVKQPLQPDIWLFDFCRKHPIVLNTSDDL